MAGVYIEVAAASVRESLGRLSAVLTDMTPVMTEIGGALWSQTQQRFFDQKDPQGCPWKPLAPVTILQRLGGKTAARGARGRLGQTLARQAASLTILRRSPAMLFDSISFEADASSVRVGTDVIYGRIHQLGGKAGRNHAVTIPQRAYLGLDLKEDQDAILRIVQRHLAHALEASS